MKLQAGDSEEIIHVEDKVIFQSEFIKSIALDLKISEDVIPLDQISHSVLLLVIKYLQHHVNTPPMSAKELQEFRVNDHMGDFEKEFFNVDKNTLFSIVKAANFLSCSRLLSCGCKAIALQIRGKSTDEIREIFGIENDFSPEEEARLRVIHKWCLNAV